MTAQTKVLKKEKGNYTVTVPIKTKEVPVLNKDKTPKLDEDDDPIMETKFIESISCEIKVDFETLKRAHGKLTISDKKGNFLGMDMIAPGEELLMFAGIQDDNWRTIIGDPLLKLSAAAALFDIVNSIKVGAITKN